jgi:asparaginyl-tRNA synthetase
MIFITEIKMLNIKNLLLKIDELKNNNENYKLVTTICGWIKTTRSSSATQMFCNVNDGSNTSGLQLILTSENISEEQLDYFDKNAKIGCFINATGTMTDSPANGQKYEMIVNNYKNNGHMDGNYPLAKSKMNLDTLRNYINFRPRTNTFGSVFRIRSKLMKAIHDYYHEQDFHHVDPNIITANECEGGAGVFQLTEKNISSLTNLQYSKEGNYNWKNDHFNKPVYLTVSSQLQLEIFACGMGNVYTVNKSFRSEHSNTNKHCSEFTHLEIEILSDSMNELMDIAENTIKYCIKTVMEKCVDDINNLNNFVSNGLIDRLTNLLNNKFVIKTYHEIIAEINTDIKDKKIKLELINDGDDLGSKHEDYITSKYNTGVFCTHWPLKIKSFYMKQSEENNKLCESFDLLLPYGIGEIVGGSMREENYEKLIENMDKKNVEKTSLEFYTDLRKYGTCNHGGYGLGFERLLMLVTGMKNIRDVLPIPVCFKNCAY